MNTSKIFVPKLPWFYFGKIHFPASSRGPPPFPNTCVVPLPSSWFHSCTASTILHNLMDGCGLFRNRSCADVSKSSNFLRPKWMDLCKLANRNRPSFSGRISLPSKSLLYSSSLSLVREWALIQVKSSEEYSGWGGSEGSSGTGTSIAATMNGLTIAALQLLDLPCCYRQLPESWQTDGLGHTSLPLPSVFPLLLIDAGLQPGFLSLSLLLCEIPFRDRWLRGRGWYRKHSGYRCRY
jgi:hypothetical protein